MKRYGNYGRKLSWILIRYGQYGRNASWIVKRYDKYGRNPSWIVKRYGKYRRTLWKDMEIMKEKDKLNSEKIWKMGKKGRLNCEML